MQRKELKKISQTRLEEAKILLKHQLFDGAKYILGYSLETALKARICKILSVEYPEKGELTKVFFTHKFDTLIFLAGLENQIDAQKFRDPNFAQNWSILTDSSLSTAWKETLRYERIGTATHAEVSLLINALEDKNHGVLTWLKKKW